MKTFREIRGKAIFAIIVCGSILSGCGATAGDRIENKNAATSESAGNQDNTIAASSNNAAAPKANATDQAVEKRTTQAPNNTGRVSSGPKPQIGTGGNDFFQFTQARAAIDSDPEFKSAKIEIDVKASVLTLNGSVPSAAHKSKAEQLVRAVGGIKEVNNRLRISNQTDSPHLRGRRGNSKTPARLEAAPPPFNARITGRYL